MSLFKQMAIMLTLLLGAVLASVMVLNFKTATEFVQNQLYTDAKNTAHSLGLSLSKVADPADPSTMETMINAIFDSGYHQRIRLSDVEGKVIYERENDVRVSDVPQWFIEMVPIHNATATSEIMMGWSRFGTLEVSGHTGNAYRQLYSTFVDLIQSFALIAVVVFVVLYLLLSFSLKSLKRIREQARAIIDNEFIIETKVPFTTEFRSVTAAMNAMVKKVKDIFDRENETLRRYHELLYVDAETKLYNRRYLTAKLPDYLQSDASLSSGAYVIVGISEIDRLKREQGYDAYLRLIRAVAQELENRLGTYPDALLARLNESDFFAALPSQEASTVVVAMERMMERMRATVDAIGAGVDAYLMFGCGVGSYTHEETLKSLFSRADHSVMQAKLRGNFQIDLPVQREGGLILGRDEWRRELQESMAESRMVLAFQSAVEECNGTCVALHEEIFLRLLDREGTVHAAGYFIPVAVSLGMIDTLDRYMIDKVLTHVRERNPVTPLALNLSGDFIKKYTNLQWLKERLEAFRRHSDMVLWFEVSNITALQELEAVASVASAVKLYGCRFGIDHFTIPEKGAHYLQAIRPDYIKAGSAYLLDMMRDTQTGSSKESFNNLVRSLGIAIIAINIEEAKEVTILKELGIEWFQGNHIAPVSLLGGWDDV